MKLSKKLIILSILLSCLSLEAIDLDAGGGGKGRIVGSNRGSDFRSMTGQGGEIISGIVEEPRTIDGVNVNIGLFQAEKTPNPSIFKYKALDSRTKEILRRIDFESPSLNPIQLRVMTRLEDISEIVLKDGTVIKPSDLIKSQ